MDPDPVTRGERTLDPELQQPEMLIEPGEDLATPQPIPDPGILADEVSANPIPMPDVPEPLEMLVGAEEVSGPLPIPPPAPGMEDGLGDIGALPVPVPYEADLIEDNLGAGMEEEPFEDLLE